MVWPVLALVVVGFLISLPATAWLTRAGRHLGTMDTAGADGHAKDLRDVPNVGGVAMVGDSTETLEISLALRRSIACRRPSLNKPLLAL